MKSQTFLSAKENYSALDSYIESLNAKKILLVHGRSMTRLKLGAYFDRLSARVEIVHFSDFTPNPDITSVERGVEVFNRAGCDAIVAVGGGSAIDTAKCIKMFSNMTASANYLEQSIVPNSIALLAIPTTAGSGSESTHFAVIYRDDVKVSVADASALPDAVLLDASTLITLPDYQRKSTLLDAFCHAVESMWSINSTSESRRYASDALGILVEIKDAYIVDAPKIEHCDRALHAANLAGRAINISKTTAAHAMSYSLTKKFGLAHGHAVARCLVELWQFMLDSAVRTQHEGMLNTFRDIASAMGCVSAEAAVAEFRSWLENWKLNASIPSTSIEELATSVNAQRLANNPLKLSNEDLRRLYQSIVG